VGQVLEPYDADKSFAVYGFGGIPPGHQITSHCFPINGNFNQPKIFGIENVTKAYHETLPMIGLSGPTFFAPVLNEFGKHVRQFQGQTVYNILVLLTDGQICDMAQTLEAIVDLSFLPCSIIIVGVGNNEDWVCMEQLDRDAGPLTDNKGR